MTYEELQEKIRIKKQEIHNEMIESGKTEEEVIKIEELCKNIVKRYNDEINRIYT